jgi:TetR/AcrR family transcriptional repressor of nem operon
MPRSKSYTKAELAERAMHVFWVNGYEATSLDDLVNATQVSRHGIYGEFGGKQALFLASLEVYQAAVVTPALGQVEAETASFGTLSAYFETQISRAEASGLPGPGCLVANAMTERAPHDHEVRERVQAHNARLRRAFLGVLRHEAADTPQAALEALADIIVIFAQGLWSASRVTADAARLRRNVGGFLEMIAERIHHDTNQA